MSSCSISCGGTKSCSLSPIIGSLAICPIERNVAPPTLSTRSEFDWWSRIASACRPAAVPVKVLGLQIERKVVREDVVQRRRDSLNSGDVDRLIMARF
jgi:hypothetical protein